METKSSKPRVSKKTSVRVADKTVVKEKPKELEEPLSGDKSKTIGDRKPSFLKIIIILVVVLVIVSGAFYIFRRTGYIKFSPTDQQVLSQLKKIILLPDNVMPTMAIVTNAETLKTQQPEFFGDAKNGDRLIIYPDLVILYDYNANKIIKVGPIQTAKTQ